LRPKSVVFELAAELIWSVKECLKIEAINEASLKERQSMELKNNSHKSEARVLHDLNRVQF
jgi:hypothetical protein